MLPMPLDDEERMEIKATSEELTELKYAAESLKEVLESEGAPGERVNTIIQHLGEAKKYAKKFEELAQNLTQRLKEMDERLGMYVGGEESNVLHVASELDVKIDNHISRIEQAITSPNIDVKTLSEVQKELEEDIEALATTLQLEDRILP